MTDHLRGCLESILSSIKLLADNDTLLRKNIDMLKDITELQSKRISELEKRLNAHISDGSNAHKDTDWMGWLWR